MIESLVKLAGSLLIGGLGLALILICVLFSIVLFKEMKAHWDDK